MTILSFLPYRRAVVVREWTSRHTYNACPDTVPRAVACRYDVEVVAVDHHDDGRDGRVWMVRSPYLSACLTRDGVWEHEPIDPYKTDVWRQEHLFDLAAARRLATWEAPNLTVDRVAARDIR
jgi:hypothetical protein